VSEKSKECPLCIVMERFCELIDPEGQECRDMLEKLKAGKITPREFANQIAKKYPQDRVRDALEKARLSTERELKKKIEA